MGFLRDILKWPHSEPAALPWTRAALRDLFAPKFYDAESRDRQGVPFTDEEKDAVITLARTDVRAAIGLIRELSILPERTARYLDHLHRLRSVSQAFREAQVQQQFRAGRINVVESKIDAALATVSEYERRQVFARLMRQCNTAGILPVTKAQRRYGQPRILC